MLESRRRLLLGAILPLALCAAPAKQRIRLPLVFEPNQGQAAPEVKFLGRNSRYTLRLGSTEVAFCGTRSGASLRMRLERGNRRASLEGLDPLPGKSFYYVGHDPSRWQTRISQYARVRYRDVYPGIDMVLYGNAGELEYDLIVAPHADVNRLRMSFEGARKLSVEANGDLRIESPSGVLWQRKPLVYQEDGGTRRPVGGSYVVEGREVRFAVEDYDAALRLVIDPAIVYATYFGGSGYDDPSALAVDSAGNVYFAGTTSSINFPAAPQGGTNVASGGTDVFVTKLDPAGKNVLYSLILGGSDDDEGFAIAADPAGNVYVTGDTLSTNFPTVKPYQSSNRGSWDAFVARVDPSGALIYSTYLGGGAKQPCGCDPEDGGYAIVADADGNAYLTGVAYSADFPTTIGTGSRTPDNGEAFVTKLGPDGRVVFSALIGGADWEAGFAIGLESSGTISVAGDTLSTDLPITDGVVQSKLAGGTNTGDVWVAKINPLGSSQDFLLALTYLGGSSDDDVYALQVDSSGNVILTGPTLSTDFPTTAGVLQPTFAGGSDTGDAWVAKLDSTLKASIFVTYFGGTSDDDAEGLALDASGIIFVMGGTASPNITPVSLGSNPRALQAGFGGVEDAYLLGLDPAGTTALYFTYLGGSGTDAGRALAIGGDGNFYLLLTTDSATMQVVQPALQPNLAGGVDAFLMNLNLSDVVGAANISSIRAAGGSGSDIAQNTWIEIKGSGLAPSDLGSNGLTWDTAPDFASGQMPTQLKEVSVKVNGKAAYVYFISPAQVNVLTPLDSFLGSAQVQVTNGSQTSAPFTVNIKAAAPAFFLLGTTKYISARHVDGSLVGLASMSAPGYTFTPAQPGELISVYANGFGLPVGGLVDGSSTQTGELPALPVIQIGGEPATVTFAGLIGPGLYQFNVVVPPSAADGDNILTADYNGFTTPAGTLIPVQH